MYLKKVSIFTKRLEIKEKHRKTFLECQMCTGNDCKFRLYTYLTTTYCFIFCNNVSDTS